MGSVKRLRDINYNQIKYSNCIVQKDVTIDELTTKERGKVIYMLGNYLNQLNANNQINLTGSANKVENMKLIEEIVSMITKLPYATVSGELILKLSTLKSRL